MLMMMVVKMCRNYVPFPVQKMRLLGGPRKKAEIAPPRTTIVKSPDIPSTRQIFYRESNLTNMLSLSLVTLPLKIFQKQPALVITSNSSRSFSSQEYYSCTDIGQAQEREHHAGQGLLALGLEMLSFYSIIIIMEQSYVPFWHINFTFLTLSSF